MRRRRCSRRWRRGPPGYAPRRRAGDAPRGGFLRKRGFFNTAWRWRWMWLDGEFLRWALKKPIVALSSAGTIGCAATDPSGERGAINLRGCAVADDAAEARRRFRQRRREVDELVDDVALRCRLW